MRRSKNSLLWKIEHPDSVRASYIYGTMHVRDDKAFGQIELVERYMSECSLLACEYNLDEAKGRGLGDVMMIPDQKVLQDFVSDRRYKRWKKICLKAFSLDLDSVQSLLPMNIISIISGQLLHRDKAISLDQFIWDKGIEMGLNLDGIETLDAQKNVMSQIDLKYQLKMLKDLFRNVNAYKIQLDNLLKLYQEQKIHKLYKTSKKSLGKYRSLLLYSRNEHMANSIFSKTVGNNAFIAVGAAHLSGKRGLLHLLKAKGMTVKPVFQFPS